jgi:hypothetical protein
MQFRSFPGMTSETSFINLGVSDVNDTRNDGKQVFTGEINFTVKDIEIFQISLETCVSFCCVADFSVICACSS